MQILEISICTRNENEPRNVANKFPFRVLFSIDFDKNTHIKVCIDTDNELEFK